jgi:hypothetical protein
MAMQILNFFEKDLSSGKSLVVMPINRLLFWETIYTCDFMFITSGDFDPYSLNPLDLNTYGNPLRGLSTCLTKFSTETLYQNPVLAFCFDIDWKNFSGLDHQQDTLLLKKISSYAEKEMDLIRFDFCEFKLPDTLPGIVGSWTNSNDYLGAQLYDFESDTSYLIAGSCVNSSIVKGLGLEIDSAPSSFIPFPFEGEVAAIASHGLRLFSDAMNASNITTKFIRIMTLLEFLASPDDYKNWKKLKSDIICHCARDKDDYLSCVERFKYLTSRVDENRTQVGIRTLIVHHGKMLEDILESETEINNLFDELQRYVDRVIRSMLHHQEMTWDEFIKYRLELKSELGVLHQQI